MEQEIQFFSSKGLNISTVEAAPLPDFYPKWLQAKVYPNPATSVINLYFEYDDRWIGREMQILDISGKIVINKIINSKIQAIDVSRLNAGIYFIRLKKKKKNFMQNLLSYRRPTNTNCEKSHREMAFF